MARSSVHREGDVTVEASPGREVDLHHSGVDINISGRPRCRCPAPKRPRMTGGGAVSVWQSKGVVARRATACPADDANNVAQEPIDKPGVGVSEAGRDPPGILLSRHDVPVRTVTLKDHVRTVGRAL